MPTYAAMKLAEALRIYAQTAPVFYGSTAHIHVHLDHLICTCIVMVTNCDTVYWGRGDV